MEAPTNYYEILQELKLKTFSINRENALELLKMYDISIDILERHTVELYFRKVPSIYGSNEDIVNKLTEIVKEKRLLEEYVIKNNMLRIKDHYQFISKFYWDFQKCPLSINILVGKISDKLYKLQIPLDQMILLTNDIAVEKISWSPCCFYKEKEDITPFNYLLVSFFNEAIRLNFKKLYARISTEDSNIFGLNIDYFPNTCESHDRKKNIDKLASEYKKLVDKKISSLELYRKPADTEPSLVMKMKKNDFGTHILVTDFEHNAVFMYEIK